MVLLFRIFALISTAAYMAPAASMIQESGRQLIIGTWHHISMVRIIDGRTITPQVSDGKGMTQFFANGTWSMLSTANKSSGKYKWLDEEHIQLTILKSNVATQIGMVSIKRIRVSNQRLEIITEQTRIEMDKVMPPIKPVNTGPIKW